MRDEHACPNCGISLTRAEGMSWQDPEGAVWPFVVECQPCRTKTGEDWTFGVRAAGHLVGAVDARPDEEFDWAGQ